MQLRIDNSKAASHSTLALSRYTPHVISYGCKEENISCQHTFRINCK